MNNNAVQDVVNYLLRSRHYRCEAKFSLGGINDSHVGVLRSEYDADQSELRLYQSGVWEKSHLKTEGVERWSWQHNQLAVHRAVVPGEEVRLFCFDHNLCSIEAYHCAPDFYRASLYWSDGFLMYNVTIEGPKKKGKLISSFLL